MKDRTSKHSIDKKKSQSHSHSSLIIMTMQNLVDIHRDDHDHHENDFYYKSHSNKRKKNE